MVDESILKDIRVLDLSRFQSGPVCGMLLGDLGAEVIRIGSQGIDINMERREPRIPQIDTNSV